MQGFVDFIREQGVVGLAVGLAIGAAAGEAVATIVDGFINPIVGYILGGSDLARESWEVVEASASRPEGLVIGWGAILSSIITLVAVAFVIYYVVRGMGLDKLDKKKKD